jgi:hypothetical protein
MARAQPDSLGRLSREDRALAVVACTLAGRRAPDLCGYLADLGRAARVAEAVQSFLDLPVAARGAALKREAARLAAPARTDTAALHPERRAEIGSDEPPLARALVAGLLGEASGAPARPHRAAIEAAQSLLLDAVAPAPWPDELAAAPAPVRVLARASSAALLSFVEALGPAHLRAVLTQTPAVVAAWIRQRLPARYDDLIAEAPACEADEALHALAELTHTGVER